MQLADGGFSAGAAGTDRFEGQFHGPAHGEAYGVFDTADWIGAFGAKRSPRAAPVGRGTFDVTLLDRCQHSRA